MKARKKGGRLTQWGKIIYEIQLDFRFPYPKMTEITICKKAINSRVLGFFEQNQFLF